MFEVGSSAFDQRTEVVVHDRHGVLGVLDLLGGDSGLERSGAGAHQGAELVTVRRRHPHQLTDDLHREPERQRVHDVDIALDGHSVDDHVGHVAHMGFEVLHASWREPPRHQASEAGVVRRVDEEHRVAHDRLLAGRQPRVEQRPTIVVEVALAQARVSQHRVAVRPSGQEPHRAQVTAVHWSHVAQLAVPRVRVGPPLGRQQRLHHQPVGVHRRVRRVGLSHVVPSGRVGQVARYRVGAPRSITTSPSSTNRSTCPRISEIDSRISKPSIRGNTTLDSS